jgi:hypothetical protein
VSLWLLKYNLAMWKNSAIIYAETGEMRRTSTCSKPPVGCMWSSRWILATLGSVAVPVAFRSVQADMFWYNCILGIPLTARATSQGNKLRVRSISAARGTEIRAILLAKKDGHLLIHENTWPYHASDILWWNDRKLNKRHTWICSSSRVENDHSCIISVYDPYIIPSVYDSYIVPSVSSLSFEI